MVQEKEIVVPSPQDFKRLSSKRKRQGSDSEKPKRKKKLLKPKSGYKRAVRDLDAELDGYMGTEPENYEEEEESVDEYKEIKEFETFEAMGLQKKMLKGIAEKCKFTEPTSIQKRGIKTILTRQDGLFAGPSGCGKSTLLCMGIMQLIDQSLNRLQAVIFTETKEQGKQVEQIVCDLGRHMMISVHACGCGRKYEGDFEDMYAIKNGIHIATGPPKRIHEMIKNKELKAKQVKILAIDGDLLNSDFMNKVYGAYRYLPYNMQILLTAKKATYPLLDITERFMKGTQVIKPFKPKPEGTEDGEGGESKDGDEEPEEDKPAPLRLIFSQRRKATSPSP